MAFKRSSEKAFLVATIFTSRLSLPKISTVPSIARNENVPEGSSGNLLSTTSSSTSPALSEPISNKSPSEKTTSAPNLKSAIIGRMARSECRNSKESPNHFPSDDPAITQLHDPFSERRIFLRMRHLDDCHSLFVQSSKQLHDFFALAGMQISSWLIRQQ